MENTNGSTFSPNHSYYVSFLSDEEEDDNLKYGHQNYWRQDKEKSWINSVWSSNAKKNNRIIDFELHSCDISSRKPKNFTHKSNEVTYQKDCSGNFQNLKNILSSQSQFRKSKACIEASNYSLQQSLELLMGKNKHEALYEDSISPPHETCKESTESIVKRSLYVGDRIMQHKIMEPVQKVVTSKTKQERTHLEAQYKQAKMEQIQITSNVAYNLDAYSNPIDMEPYYNKSQRTLPIKAKRLKMKVCNNQYQKTSNCANSHLQFMDWGNDILIEDVNDYSNGFSSRQPQEICNDLKTTSIFHSSQNVTQSRAKLASQKKIQHMRLLQQIKEGRPQKHSTYVSSTMLGNHDLVKNCCRVGKRNCGKKKLDNFLKKTHDSSDNNIIHQRNDLEAFCEEKDKRMKCKQMSSLLVNPIVLKYKNNDWTSSKTKVSHSHGSSKLKLHLANQCEHKDYGNTSWNFGPIGKSPTTIHSNDIISNNKKIEQVNLIDFNMDISSALLEKNISSQEENVATDISKRTKIGISSNQTVKNQILYSLNSSRENQQTIHKTSQNMAYCWDDNKKTMDSQNLQFNILRERKLETLNVIEYKSLEVDGGTVSETKDPYRVGVYDICDQKKIGSNPSISFDVATTLENSQIKIRPWKTKGGKENRGQIETKCVPSNLEENEDIKNKKLPTQSSTIEDQRLQVSIYDSNHPRVNVYTPKLFVEDNLIDKIQVHNNVQESNKELHLQNIKLLKLLQDLEFQHQTSKICNIKIEGMIDATVQCGYLAQYLKTKKKGLQRKNHLSTLRK